MVKNNKIINIMWPIVISTTVILYALILITLPFSSKTATILLFALIAYWSRIPGVGIPSPFFILYRADVVDLFSILIAINVGPVQGALFSIFGNFWSRVAGVTPYWRGVLKDTVIQAVTCLVIPLIYNIFNQNIFYTVIAFTILHRIGFIIFHLTLPDMSNMEFLVLWTGASGSIFFVNIIYGKYFGDFFDGLLKTGVEFNWTLFAIATLLIVFIRIYFGKKSNDDLKKSFSTRLEGWVKLRIYLFVSSIQKKSVRHLILKVITQWGNQETDEKVSKKSDEYVDLMQIRNPEDVALGFFDSSNDEQILEGRTSTFYIRAISIVIGMIIFTCVLNKYIPSFIEGIFGIMVSIFSVLLVVWFVKNLVPSILRLV